MLRTLTLTALLVPAIAGAESGDRLPAYLLDVPASVATILVADTSRSTLHRFANGPDGIRHVDEHYMSVGQYGVGKQHPGDRRTPLGIYFVTERLDTSKLHAKYGPVAFSLDYPNPWDRINERSGDGIWIHGVADESGRRPPLDTDGCIALANDELLMLEPFLAPIVTPVIVARRLRWADSDEVAVMRAALESALATWAESIRSGDLHAYLSLYAADFGYRGMMRTEWAAFRARTFALASVDAFATDEVLLLVDPEDDGLYLSRFRQTLVESGRAVVTVKRLYWRRTDDGFRIVAEDNG